MKFKTKFYLFFFVLAILFTATGPWRIQPEKTEAVLSTQGYTNVSTSGYGWFKCGSGDIFATKFTATAINGQTVAGCYCEGLFKGGTVRVGSITN